MFVVFHDERHDEADVCETMEDVRRVINERRDDDVSYFDEYIAPHMQVWTLGERIPVTFVPARIEIGNVPTVSDASEPVQNMLAVMELLERRNPREGEPGQSHSFVNGFTIQVKSDTPNDYQSDELSVIPAGNDIVLDFGGDFGVYGMTQVGEVLHKIKIKVSDLHRLDWTPFL
ncbi:MAG: hypothetical protein EOO38_12715 [Cytophagaceae bacterium]|nr:MAG: hypothetical protein EOO38_12715 [Cytophagaceae bacterium]